MTTPRIHDFTDLARRGVGSITLVDAVHHKTSAVARADQSAYESDLERKGYERALQDMRKHSSQLGILKGQVAAFVGRMELVRIKESQTNGVCWKCHAAAADPMHPFLLCTSCAN
jgi:hypothetical protein